MRRVARNGAVSYSHDMRIQLLYNGSVLHTVAIEFSPVTVGRSGANSVVLSAQDVSGHHAVIYADSGGVWLKDLGSSNGTFHNEVAVTEPVQLAPGDAVRFASAVHARVVESDSTAKAAMQLTRDDAPLALPIVHGQLRIPSRPTLELVRSDEEWWLAEDGEQVRRVNVGEVFDVDGVPYRIQPAIGGDDATVRPAAGHPYALSVDLEEGVATLRALQTGAVCTFRTDNRVAFLYALAQRWVADGPGSGRGWLSDEDIATAVWGRSWREQGANNLHVLVHRVREDVEAAGFDRWFVEKRRGRTRVSVQQVQVR